MTGMTTVETQALQVMPMLTRRWASERSWSLESYQAQDGYRALAQALTLQPGQLVDLVKASGLRGRGGAGFPTGLKWSFLPQGDGKPHYLVVNADEGEPGTCKDLPLMMADPHSLIEGCLITCYAINSHFAAIYVRGEALHAMRRLEHAIREARAANLLGTNICGSGFDCEIVVHGGAGAYICGEETALLDSLEGRRGQPRLKPPFPAVEGLYACPTVVNNVETICNVPPIVLGGSDWYRQMGTDKSPGTKIYSLSGHIERPGQYEAPMGTTMRQLIKAAGGMKDGVPLKFWSPGGSSTPMFTPDQLDVPLSFDDVAAAGSMLGTTALMVFNETVSVPWAVWKWLEFYKHESCGKCTPCREGTTWLTLILRRVVSGQGRMEDLDILTDAASNIAGRSFCALGDAAATPVLASFKHFRSDYEDLVTGRVGPLISPAEMVGAH